MSDNNLSDQPRWIVRMHLNAFIKEDFKQLKMESLYFECLLRDIHFLDSVDISELDQDSRLAVSLQFSKLRQCLSECHRYLNEIASNWQKIEKDNLWDLDFTSKRHISNIISDMLKNNVNYVDAIATGKVDIVTPIEKRDEFLKDYKLNPRKFSKE